MKLIIKGIGGQGVLFLSKVLAEALMFQGITDFSFLKEFDEAQRGGEVIVTFNLSENIIKSTFFNKGKITFFMREFHNMNVLMNINNFTKVKNENIKKALKKLKPKQFEKNWKIYNAKD